MVINSPCLIDKKELAIPGKTTTGKEFSNLLMAGSLLKTIISLDLSKLATTLNRLERSIQIGINRKLK
ncbi:hypothetical protein Tco_0118709, partial [Tanacetum coccineum]